MNSPNERSPKEYKQKDPYKPEYPHKDPPSQHPPEIEPDSENPPLDSPTDKDTEKKKEIKFDDDISSLEHILLYL